MTITNFFHTLVLLGVILGSSCSDRPTDESQEELHARLCTQDCEARVRCSESRGGDLEQQACMDGCMTKYFGDHITGCAQISIRELECKVALTGLCESRESCDDEEYVFSVCRGDPEGWAANNCDDKCPGECCQNMDSGRQ